MNMEDRKILSTLLQIYYTRHHHCIPDTLATIRKCLDDDQNELKITHNRKLSKGGLFNLFTMYVYTGDTAVQQMRIAVKNPPYGSYIDEVGTHRQLINTLMSHIQKDISVNITNHAWVSPDQPHIVIGADEEWAGYRHLLHKAINYELVDHRVNVEFLEVVNTYTTGDVYTFQGVAWSGVADIPQGHLLPFKSDVVITLPVDTIPILKAWMNTTKVRYTTLNLDSLLSFFQGTDVNPQSSIKPESQIQPNSIESEKLMESKHEETQARTTGVKNYQCSITKLCDARGGVILNKSRLCIPGVIIRELMTKLLTDLDVKPPEMTEYTLFGSIAPNGSAVIGFLMPSSGEILRVEPTTLYAELPHQSPSPQYYHPINNQPWHGQLHPSLVPTAPPRAESYINVDHLHEVIWKALSNLIYEVLPAQVLGFSVNAEM